MYLVDSLKRGVVKQVLCGCLVVSLLAIPRESAAIKWADVSPELLALNDNPYEPGAGALIVFNDANIQLFYGDYVWIEMEVYRRIKVFTDDGKRYASVALNYASDEKISNVKARVTLPNGDTIELRENQIIDEARVSGAGRYASMVYGRQKKFTIPGVVPGSIVEYQYLIKSERTGHLRSWYFQGSDYTLSSTLKATVPKEIQYSGAFINVREEPKSSVEKWVDGRGTTYTWRLDNLPGVKEEIFGPRLEAMRAGMNFVLTRAYSRRMGTMRHILDSWDQVTGAYADYYRSSMGKRGDIARVVNELTTSIADPTEKIAIIFDYVQRNIQYFDTRHVLTKGQYSGAILAGKQAENVGMNVLLCTMLDEANIKTSFAMLAPLGGPPLNQAISTPVQFERLITHVPMGDGTDIWLDPTVRGTPLGVLPWQDQGAPAFLLQGKGEFRELPKTSHLNKETRTLSLTLNAEGHVSGKGTVSASGENATRYRRQFAFSGEQERKDRFLKDLQEQVSSAELTSFAYEDQVLATKPVEISFTFSGIDYATVAGDRLLINPAVLDRFDTDVLVAGERRSPIMLGAVSSITEEVTIALPTGYDVEQKPSVVVQKSQFGRFIVTYTERNGKLIYKRMFTISKPNNGPEYYADLRALFDRISESDQQQIVLIRSGAGEGESR